MHTRFIRKVQKIMAVTTLLSLLSFLLPVPLITSSALAATVKVVSGKITDSSGAAVAAVRVELHTPDGLKSFNTTSDTSGNYTFTVDTTQLANGDSLVLEVQVPSGYNKPSNSPTNFTWSGSTYTGDPVNFELVSATKTVTGSITFKGTTTAKSGVEVQACPVNNPSVGCVSGSSNALGVYSMTLRPVEGQWSVKPQVNLSDHRTDWLSTDSPVLIAFKNDSTTESQTVNFTVEKTTASVTGVFKDANGNPLTSNQFRADCSIVQADGVGTVRKVDENSKLTEIGLPAGIYTIWCFHSALTGQSFNLTDARFVLKPDEKKDLGTIQAQKNSAKITGKLKTSDGTAISNQQVTLSRSETPEFSAMNSGSDGSFSFTVGAGTWKLGLQQGDPNQSGNQASFYRLTAPKVITIETNGDTSADNDLTAELMSQSVSGTLKDSAGTTLSSFSGSVYVHSESGETFSVPVKSGAYKIPLPATFQGKTVTVGVSSDIGSTYALTKEQTVTVATSATKDLTLSSDSSIISGTLLDDTGATVQPAANDVSVVAVDDNGNIEKTTVGTDGKYSLTVPEGNWHVTFSVEDSAKYASPVSQDNLVKVTSGQTTTNNLTTKKEDATISGKVTNASGAAVALAPVIITNLPVLEAKGSFKPEDVVQAFASADASGNYTATLPDGTYTVYTGTTPELAETAVKPEAQTVTVASGATGTANLAFTTSNATIAGTVKDASGTAVKGGTVAAFTEKGGFVEGQIGTDGSFSLPVAEKGEWKMMATALSGKDLLMAKDVTVTAAAGTNTQNLTAKDSGIDVPGPITKSFDATAVANISLPNGGSVQLSPFAVDTSGTLSVSIEPRIDLSPTLSGDPVSVAYDVTVRNADGVEKSKLDIPAKITMPYSEKLLGGVKEENLLPQFFSDEEQYWGNDGTATVINKEENEVVVYSEHFTKFSINGTSTGSVASTTTAQEEHIIVSPAGNSVADVAVYQETGKRVSKWNAFGAKVKGGFKAMSANLDGEGDREVVVVGGKGVQSQVRVFTMKGKLKAAVSPFGSSDKSGLTMVMADVNADGKEEILVSKSTAKATTTVKAYSLSGSKLTLLTSIDFKNSTAGGPVSFVAGDPDGDGTSELVGSLGGGKVTLYDLTDNSTQTFTPFQAKSKIQVALGDIDGDGKDEIAVSYLSGGNSDVKVYSWDGASTFTLRGSAISPYGKKFTSGVNVALGDTDGDGSYELATAPAGGVASDVKVYRFDSATSAFKSIDSGVVYAKTYKGGASIVMLDTDKDGDDELAVAPAGKLQPQVKVYNFPSGSDKRKAMGSFIPFAKTFRGGVNVAK